VRIAKQIASHAWHNGLASTYQLHTTLEMVVNQYKLS